MIKNSLFIRMLIASIVIILLCPSANAERIKDISSISGIRGNQLVGYGLVVGLDGSGDNSDYTSQSFKTMLARLGVQLPLDIKAKSKNIAAVALHADLPAFARPGQQIDVTVSSIGNAKSLRGGTLLLSPLKGADGNVYALAQGNLVVSGFGAEGADGSKITVNIPVAGRIPNGATVEVPSPSVFNNNDSITLLLHRNDFTTAKRVADVINRSVSEGTASPIDAGAIRVNVPVDSGNRVQFLSFIENLLLDPGEEAAKVIVNSRTGTIVIGKHVVVGPAAVAHGSLTVTVSETEQVSQAQAFAPGGETVVTPDSNISVNQGDGKMFVIKKGVSLENIVRMINQVGAAPGDLMAILEALKEAGALSADLEVL